MNRSLSVSQIPWTLRDLFWIFIFEGLAFFGMILFAPFILTFFSPPWFSNPALQTLLIYLFQTIFLLVPLYFFTFFKYGARLSDFGMKSVSFKALSLSVAQGFFFYYLISLFLFQILSRYDLEIPGYGEQESHIPLFGDTPMGIFLAIFVMIGIAPLVEELFFRGYVYPIFKKHFTIPVASVFSALLFGFFHLEFQVLIPLFLLGLILNWLFEKTRSLWTPIVFHMINNAFAFLIEFAIYFQWVEVPV